MGVFAVNDEQETFHQLTKESEKKLDKSKWYYIYFARNSPNTTNGFVVRPYVQDISGKKWSLTKATTDQTLIQTTSNHRQGFDAA